MGGACLKEVRKGLRGREDKAFQFRGNRSEFVRAEFSQGLCVVVNQQLLQWRKQETMEYHGQDIHHFLRWKEAAADGKCATIKQEGSGNHLKGMRSMVARNSRPNEDAAINSPQTKAPTQSPFSFSSSDLRGFLFLCAHWNGLESLYLCSGTCRFLLTHELKQKGTLKQTMMQTH